MKYSTIFTIQQKTRKTLTAEQCTIANGHSFSSSTDANQRRQSLRQHNRRCWAELKWIWLVGELLKAAHVLTNASRIVVVVSVTWKRTTQKGISLHVSSNHI